MPQYSLLVNLTDQVVRNVNRLRELIAEAGKVWEANGIRLVQGWSTLGPYDLVAVFEGPDDATMMKASALVARQGNFRAITMPAVPTNAFAAAVK
jgi:uncharacterized protein with GYD domain